MSNATCSWPEISTSLHRQPRQHQPAAGARQRHQLCLVYSYLHVLHQTQPVLVLAAAGTLQTLPAQLVSIRVNNVQTKLVLCITTNAVLHSRSTTDATALFYTADRGCRHIRALQGHLIPANAAPVKFE